MTLTVDCRESSRASRPCATYKMCQPGRGRRPGDTTQQGAAAQGGTAVCADTAQRRGGQTDAGHHQQQQATVAHPRPGLKRGRGQISLRIALVSPQTVCLGRSDIVSGTIRHQPDIRQRFHWSADIRTSCQTSRHTSCQTSRQCLDVC